MSTAPRLPDWPVRLEALLLERETWPFAWGVHDCALFAADAVQAITGHDLAHGLRGLAVRAALRELRRHGPTADMGLYALTTQALGPSMAPAWATVGDVLMLPMGRRCALAVCNGNTAIGPGRHGLMHAAASTALAAWRVG